MTAENSRLFFLHRFRRSHSFRLKFFSIAVCLHHRVIHNLGTAPVLILSQILNGVVDLSQLFLMLGSLIRHLSVHLFNRAFRCLHLCF